jgi:hypothetical protein
MAALPVPRYGFIDHTMSKARNQRVLDMAVTNMVESAMVQPGGW